VGLPGWWGRVLDGVFGERAEGGEDGQGKQFGPRPVDEAGAAEVASGPGEDRGDGAQDRD